MAVFPAAFPVLPLYDPARYNSVNLGAHVRVEMLESFAALLQDHYADCYADFGSYVDEMIRRCFVMINRLEVS
jgi:hypothetical protein